MLCILWSLHLSQGHAPVCMPTQAPLSGCPIQNSARQMRLVDQPTTVDWLPLGPFSFLAPNNRTRILHRRCTEVLSHWLPTTLRVEHTLAK